MKEPPDPSHIGQMIERLKENWNEIRQNWPDAFSNIYSDLGPYVRVLFRRSDFEPLYELEPDDPFLSIWFDYQYLLWYAQNHYRAK